MVRPRTQFRYALAIEGIDSREVKSVRSLEGSRLEVTVSWWDDKQLPDVPVVREGRLSLYPQDGEFVPAVVVIQWKSVEILPFQLDSEKCGLNDVRFIFGGVKYSTDTEEG